MNKSKVAEGRGAALPSGAETRDLRGRGNGSGQMDTGQLPCLHLTFEA